MSGKVIAVIGGTGDLGAGLVKRWADAGFEIVIGSRKQEKAEDAAAKFLAENGARNIVGTDNYSAAEKADVVAVTVPFDHQRSTLETIKGAVEGKLVIDTTVCLKPPKVGTVQLPPEGSAGMIAEAVLGDVARVVSAFQNVPASELEDVTSDIHCDILVTGNDKEARAEVIDLIKVMGARGFSAGPMANAVAAEALTSILITINRQYKTHAGIMLTNIEG